MMYEIDPAVLKRTLENTTENESEPDFVDPYLRKAVFEPILREQSLTPSQIDYSRFTLEDLHDLLEFAEKHYKLIERLEAINEKLCKHPPRQETRRTYC